MVKDADVMVIGVVNVHTDAEVVMEDMVMEAVVMGVTIMVVMEDMDMMVTGGMDMVVMDIAGLHIITIIMVDMVHGVLELKQLKIFQWKMHLDLDLIIKSFKMML